MKIHYLYILPYFNVHLLCFHSHFTLFFTDKPPAAPRATCNPCNLPPPSKFDEAMLVSCLSFKCQLYQGSASRHHHFLFSFVAGLSWIVHSVMSICLFTEVKAAVRYVSTEMGDCFSAWLVSLMSLWLALVDRNPLRPCFTLESNIYPYVERYTAWHPNLANTITWYKPKWQNKYL